MGCGCKGKSKTQKFQRQLAQGKAASLPTPAAQYLKQLQQNRGKN